MLIDCSMPRCIWALVDDNITEHMMCTDDEDARSWIATTRIKVASDCRNVISSLEEGTMGAYAHIAREINEARSEFTEISFCHEGQGSNKEAHNLARSVVYDVAGQSIWLLNPPDGRCIPMIVEV
jgi:hypothetical protein